MTFRSLFRQSPAFSLENNLFYQRNFQRPTRFEPLYLSLRKKENRVHPDEVVKVLPDVPAHHPLRKEWLTRKFTVQRLIPYLRNKNQPKILELGCGNGWLCSHLARLPGSEVVGMDVNETELVQASKVFAESKNLTFLYADILTAPLPFRHFDYIILSASIQYFRDIRILFDKLLDLLADGGEIHIVDSPVYDEKDLSSARNRSKEYFSLIGFPSMQQHYHHHSWKSLKAFHSELLYDPNTFFNRMRRKFSVASPFPWIKIVGNEIRS